MEETQDNSIIYVDGIKFKLDNKGYYLGFRYGNRIRLHRYIWEKHNGKIPKGYDIHHIDGNRLNNDISNLIMLTPSEHHKLHANNMTEEQKAVRDRNLDLYARPKACEWHGSEEGRGWHKEHGKKVAKKLKDVKIKKVCRCCGKEFYDNGFNGASFCSNKCKSKWRRDAGLDNEKRICIICGKEFTVNKYSKIKTCSASCGSTLGHRTREDKFNNKIGEERDSIQHDCGKESQLFDW